MTNQSDAERLLPCPFCNWQPPTNDLSDALYPNGIYRRKDVSGRYHHYVSMNQSQKGDEPCWQMGCTENMGGCGALINADSRDEAISKWNSRAARNPGAGRFVPIEPKGWTKERGYHALVQVIYELQNDGRYSDDEGEETEAMVSLVLRMEEADAATHTKPDAPQPAHTHPMFTYEPCVFDPPQPASQTAQPAEPLSNFHIDLIFQRYCPNADITPELVAFARGIEEAAIKPKEAQL